MSRRTEMKILLAVATATAPALAFMARRAATTP
jgi:hypothetical protein